MSIPAEITTSDGRVLALREIDPADMLDLIEAAGSALTGQSGEAWLAYAQMICTVTGIDGVPVQMPNTKDEVKDLARKIGNKGMVALQPIFYGDEKKPDAPKAENEAAKN